MFILWSEIKYLATKELLSLALITTKQDTLVVSFKKCSTLAVGVKFQAKAMTFSFHSVTSKLNSRAEDKILQKNTNDGN